MRRVLIISLLAGLAGSAIANTQRPIAPLGGRRKTLGFGPNHPHAVFHTQPHEIRGNGFMPMNPSADPREVADRFARNILAGHLSDSLSYHVRKDSYTDRNTGISHVYLRQVVNGIEVADGDMNINIKDGMVISYGSSFYQGPVPTPFENLNTEHSQPHVEYCDHLRSQYQDHLVQTVELTNGDSQVILGPHERIDSSISEHHRDDLYHLMNSHCSDTLLSDATHSSVGDIADPRHALLQFMLHAIPSADLVSNIQSEYGVYLNKMREIPTHDFAPSGNPIEFLIENVPDTINPVKARMAYIQVPDKTESKMHLELVWKFEVEMRDNWYEAAVSATAPHNIVSVVDWASDSPAPVAPIPGKPQPASYRVFAWGVNDPSEAERTLEKENIDSIASPAGWHAIPYANDPSIRNVRLARPSGGGGFWHNTTTTWGNNVFAQENWEGQNSFVNNKRPDAGDAKRFDFPYDPKETERSDALGEARKYIDNTVAQLFYTSNLVHDLYYRYGFDEVSGNFQAYNFGRGGAEDDAVIANAQDGSGFNNANFMTPPDGQNGRMRMYVWNTALPYRDGDLEAGIVIHELSHGLSTRLTGGPANSGCLGWGESGGMGEGWGDFLATTIRSTNKYSDYPMGAWAANRTGGIRNYIYSLDNSINPSTYKTLDKPGYWGVHAIGEVWAEILWVVSQGLIEKHGFTETLFPPQPLADGTIPHGDFYRPPQGAKGLLIPKHGNSLMVQLVLNAMKLQPCRPSFFEARDAIIQADQVLTGGENYCILWDGFSKRGLGSDSKVEGRTPWGGGIRTNGFAVPTACRS